MFTVGTLRETVDFVLKRYDFVLTVRPQKDFEKLVLILFL